MQKSVRFYAELGEVCNWIREIINKDCLFIAYVTFFPKYSVVKVEKIEDLIGSSFKFNLLLFRINEFDYHYNGQLDFHARNKDTIIYHYSGLDNNVIRESSLGVVSENMEILKIASSMIRAIKKNTKSGMWIANFNMNVKGFVNSYHYSNRISKLYDQNVELKPLGGDNQVFIQESDIIFEEQES